MAATSTFSFRAKLILAALLAALADQLFYGQAVGWTLGAFDLAVTATVLAVHPAIRRDPRAACALGIAASFALLQVETPSLLSLLLCWTALAVAALSARVRSGEAVQRWGARLVFLAVAGLIGPARDAIHLSGKLAARRRPAASLLPLLVAPLIGGAGFVALFALANPVIDQALASIPTLWPDALRILFATFVVTAVWALLRPRLARLRARPATVRPAMSGGVFSVAVVCLCLLTFNLIFALQNALDIAFLWSGVRLPPGVTYAQYAHRGAYALMATALLAGLFVLVALRPGTPTAAAPWPRQLVTLWVAQTLLLVASSMLRTLNYVQAYSLTAFRIAALIWMALVGVGLVLICWRLLRGRSGDWLIGANALAAAVALALCSGVDLDAVAAGWNVSHAREAGGDGPPLDLCYLSQLGDAALVPLSEMERRPLPANLRDRVVWTRGQALAPLQRRQGDWRGWTWRGQRRLESAENLDPRDLATTFRGPAYLLCSPARGD